MSKELMVSSLPFRFQNVGTTSSCGDNVKVAPPLIIEELFCMMNEVEVQVKYIREADRAEIQRLSQEAIKRQAYERFRIEEPRPSLGGGCMGMRIFDGEKARAVAFDNLFKEGSGEYITANPFKRMAPKMPMEDGVGDNIIWIPEGWDHSGDFLAKQCLMKNIRPSLKLWEIIVWANRLQFKFCDIEHPGRDRHLARACIDIEGKITLQARVRAEAFRGDPERLLFVRYGNDAADGWGSFVDVATGTEKLGIAKTRFYPEGSMEKFVEIAKDG